jgi:hypothetical protein
LKLESVKQDGEMICNRVNLKSQEGRLQIFLSFIGSETYNQELYFLSWNQVDKNKATQQNLNESRYTRQVGQQKTQKFQNFQRTYGGNQGGGNRGGDSEDAVK